MTTYFRNVLRGCGWFICGLLAVCRLASAHEISPAVVDANFHSSKAGLDIVIRQNFELLLSGMDFKHADTNDSPQKATYDNFRRMPVAELTAAIAAFLPAFLGQLALEVDGKPMSLSVVGVRVEPNPNVNTNRWTQVTLHADGGAPPRTLRWTYGKTFGPSILRVKEVSEGAVKTFWLEQGRSSPRIELADIRNPDAWSQLRNFVQVGYVHILPLGFDHILFIIGVYFLARTLRQIVTLVTTFTVAHSITLYLGVKAIVVLPGVFVEAGIALSIAIVGIEILRKSKDKAFLIKVGTVFFFGLFHGLGFAGVLAESGFKQDQILVPLVAFNVGVELGQLTVIMAVHVVMAYLLVGRETARRFARASAGGLLTLGGLALFVSRIV